MSIKIEIIIILNVYYVIIQLILTMSQTIGNTVSNTSKVEKTVFNVPVRNTIKVGKTVFNLPVGIPQPPEPNEKYGSRTFGLNGIVINKNTN